MPLVPCPSDGTIPTLNAMNSVIRFVSDIILHHSIVVTVHDISLSADPRIFTVDVGIFHLDHKNPLLVYVGGGKKILSRTYSVHGQRRTAMFVISQYFSGAEWMAQTQWLIRDAAGRKHCFCEDI